MVAKFLMAIYAELNYKIMKGYDDRFTPYGLAEKRTLILKCRPA